MQTNFLLPLERWLLLNPVAPILKDTTFLKVVVVVHFCIPSEDPQISHWAHC